MRTRNKKWGVCGLWAGLAFSPLCGAAETTLGGDAERFEFYDEALRMFNAVPAGGDITADGEKRAELGYGRTKEPGLFVRDYTDKAANDFSVRFDAPGTEAAQVIGFNPGPWIELWKVGANAVLHMQLKATPDIGLVRLVLIDHAKKRSTVKLSGFKADGTWQALKAPLTDFQPEAGFDFAKGLMGCEVQAAFPQGANIWFDDIYFALPDGSVLGVTEKPIEQRIAEAKATREARQAGPAPKPDAVYAYNAARIARGEDLDEANRLLAEFFLSEEGRKSYRSGFFFGHPEYHLLALDYGKHGRIAPGRLSPDAENALLEVVWESARVSDDIANTRMSTWWILGSENHDILYKLNCLLTSRILSLYPDFVGRVYEDDGRGNGYGDDDPNLQGDGKWADGKAYTPVDHYRAWVGFFREYIRERAKRGLFVEVRSNHYINAQINSISAIHTYGGDEELCKLAGMLLDLIWADYVQDSMSGINGGAKTRSSVRTRMADTIVPLLGGPGGVDLDYELPPVLWKLALKREPLGEYAYLSRRPGEEEDIWPRPAGGERAQMMGADSRFVRYSWVTPDYVLGTQMDHPAAPQSHTSIISRWTGVTFSSSVSVSSWNKGGVYPYLAPKPEYGGQNKYIGGQHYKDFMYHSVQDRNVLILQQPKPMRVRHVSPQWYPTDHAPWTGKDIGVYMEDADEIAEQKGWVFVRKGNAYVAVRAVMPEDLAKRDSGLVEESYTWNETHSFMQIKDPYSPVIMETGRKAVNGSFAAFQAAVLANPIRIRPLIAGNYELSYRGSGPEARELVFNHDSNALPTVGGEPINFSYPNVYESPYIYSEYGSGVVTIRRGDEERVLDFRVRE